MGKKWFVPGVAVETNSRYRDVTMWPIQDLGVGHLGAYCVASPMVGDVFAIGFCDRGYWFFILGLTHMSMRGYFPLPPIYWSGGWEFASLPLSQREKKETKSKKTPCGQPPSWSSWQRQAWSTPPLLGASTLTRDVLATDLLTQEERGSAEVRSVEEPFATLTLAPALTRWHLRLREGG